MTKLLAKRLVAVTLLSGVIVSGGTAAAFAAPTLDINTLCAGLVIVNRQNGTHEPLPEQCPEELKKANGE